MRSTNKVYSAIHFGGAILIIPIGFVMRIKIKINEIPKTQKNMRQSINNNIQKTENKKGRKNKNNNRNHMQNATKQIPKQAEQTF